MTVLQPYLQYYDRLRNLDRAGAIALVEDYLNRGGDVKGLYVDVLMPALIHTGREWESNQISVAHEHYISEVTRDLIRRYGPRLWSGPYENRPVTVACCAPGERHSIGLMMVCDILRAEGFDVHSLGEGAPAESIRDFVVEVSADLLCLSVGLEEHLDEATRLIQMAKGARPNLLVLAGGRAFDGDPESAFAIGADRFSSDARELHELLTQLIQGHSNPSQANTPGEPSP